jgi:glyoxylase-like metal-dependent hydrolase (beta-lactamase superfamily II)
MTAKFYSFKVGDLDCVALQDSTLTGPMNLFFSNANAAECEAIVRGLGYDPQAIPGGNTCLTVRNGDGWVLIDTGNGVAMADHGTLLESLRLAEISPSDVHTIILSHGHGDHYGGLIDGEGNFNFPNARVVMLKDEWEWWTSAEKLAEFERDAPARLELLQKYLLPILPKLELVEDGAEVVTGISVVYAPGHTYHHIAIRVASNGESLIYTGDAFLHPLHVAYPDWVFSNDIDAEKSQATHRNLVKLAAQPDTLLMAYHFEFPAVGRVSLDSGHWVWQPLEVVETTQS